MNLTDMLTLALVRRKTYKWAVHMQSLCVVLRSTDVIKYSELLAKQQG